MHKPFTIFLLLAFMACKHKNQPAAAIDKTDTIIPVMDTAINSYTAANHLRDSLQWKHTLDSFYAIKPQAIFITDNKTQAIRKLIATAIDTSGVTITPIQFSDTTIRTYDKKENPVSERRIYKSKRFTVEVADRNVNEFAPKKILVNGQKLRPGIEMDTSVFYEEYFNLFELDAWDCAIMKFGNKEYLFLRGGIERCNGNACGVNYYILYDPTIKKALLLQQYRSDFIAGYDPSNKTPLFIDMRGANEYDVSFQCFMMEGKAYRIDRNCKAKPVTDKAGKQLHFTAWSKDDPDTVKLIAGNLPVNK